jgi:hypothetical protein
VGAEEAAVKGDWRKDGEGRRFKRGGRCGGCGCKEAESGSHDVEEGGGRRIGNGENEVCGSIFLEVWNELVSSLENMSVELRRNTSK